MTKKLSFKEFAEFIADDVTIEIFPDIVWPVETRLHKDKMTWLAERLETLHKRYKENPNAVEEQVEVVGDPDDFE